MKTKPLNNIQLVRLIKLGLIIFGFVVFVSFIVSIVFTNGLDNYNSPKN
jgi:hypothetical protein